MSTKSKAKGTIGTCLDMAGRDLIRARLFSGGVPAQGGCIVWTRYVRPAGYGQMGVGRKALDVHRISYALERGDIPEGMFVLHRCDNRRCFHPGHLYAGTHADNMRDMHTRGREARGFMLPHTRLSGEQVAEIRRRYVREYERYRYGWRSNGAVLAGEFGISRQYLRELIQGKYR